MAELYAGLIFYNDTPAVLKACMNRLKAAGLDGIIAIDGPFAEFPRAPGEGLASHDGCLEVAREMASEVIEAPGRPWATQMEKRTRYFKAIPPGAYCLVIDADEFLCEGVVDKTGLQHDFHCVCMETVEADGRVHDSCALVRVYKIYEDLECIGRHCYIYRRSKYRPESPAKGLYPNYGPHFLQYTSGEFVGIQHKPWMRSQARLEQDGIYMAQRSEIRFAGRNYFHIKEEEKENWPGPDATGINRLVSVQYCGEDIYNGWLTMEATMGKIFTIPFWRYSELLMSHGPKVWRLK